MKNTLNSISKKILSVNKKSDKLFLLNVLLLSLFGTAMVFSAGGPYAEARYGDEFYFIKKQTIWLIIGFVVAYIASNTDMKIYKKYTPHFYAITVILLILVLAVGFVGNGAQRWLSIGPLTLQPSEIAKLSMLMMLSYYFSEKEEVSINSKGNREIFLFGTLYPALIMLLPIILVMLQRHLSCIIILGTIGLSMIFVSGINPKYIYSLCTLGTIGVSYIALFTDYTKERITVWQNPEAYKLTGGWQTLQGLMAIGTGGIFGVGFGKSILKHCYVSEPANDMIYAIICEELGLAGGVAVILLFAFLIWRGTVIALRSSDVYTRLIVLGICIKTAVQILLNIAVVTNSIPNTGISLPFFSYGGSSLVMLFFEMGIILSASKSAVIIK